MRVLGRGVATERIDIYIYVLTQKAQEHLQGCSFCFAYIYMSICSSIIPQTQGSPNIPLPPTVHQLSGIKTPVNFCVILISAIAVKPNKAFKIIDFIIFLLFICNISSINPQSDSQTTVIIPRVFKKITYINICVKKQKILC